MLPLAASLESLDSRMLRGESRMIPVGYAHQLSCLGGGATSEREHIKQPTRAEERVNPWVLHLTQDGNPLRCIFLRKNRNLGLGEEATRH